MRIAILTLSRGIIQSKADPLRREKLCPNLLSPKFADAQMSSNFLPKFFVLKYIEPKVLAHKFLNTKVVLIIVFPESAVSSSRAGMTTDCKHIVFDN